MGWMEFEDFLLHTTIPLLTRKGQFVHLWMQASADPMMKKCRLVYLTIASLLGKILVIEGNSDIPNERPGTNTSRILRRSRQHPLDLGLLEFKS